MLTIGGKKVLSTLEELLDPKRTALLLIDIQNDYLMPGGYADKMGWDRSAFQLMVPRVKQVLETARRSRVLVIHVQMTFYDDFRTESPAYLHLRLLRLTRQNITSIRPLPYCIDGTRGWQIVDELAPLPNEIVVKKNRTSAFVGTNLDMILRSNSIESVAIVGLASHACVMAAANDAPYFGYYPVVLRDCVADRLPEFHEAAFLIMSETKNIADSEDVIRIWKKSTRRIH